MTELEQLKQKYPLAFDTIKLPVRYEKKEMLLRDSDGRILTQVYYQHGRNTEELKNQIGELIAHLLNQLQNEETN